jgi:hypothetical protein
MSIGVRMLERMQHSFEVEGNLPTQDEPSVVTLGTGSRAVRAEVCAYDSLGVALHTLSVVGDNSDTPLEELAQSISRRVRYLWEPLALIERDLERDQVQMRSVPPLIEDDTIEFYEGLLTRQNGASHLHLVRYRQPKGQGRRTRMPITLTHDIFRRLVNDLSAILQTPETE